MTAENSIDLLSEIGFVRLENILKIFPVGKSTWWQGVKDKKYPKPVRLSERMVAWKIQDIKSLIESYDYDDV